MKIEIEIISEMENINFFIFSEGHFLEGQVFGTEVFAKFPIYHCCKKNKKKKKCNWKVLESFFFYRLHDSLDFLTACSIVDIIIVGCR